MRGRGVLAVVVLLLLGCTDDDGAAPTTTTTTAAACPGAGVRITVEDDTTLDPDCRYGGIDVTGSALTLDCAGALVRSDEAEGIGLLVTTPVDEPQSDVTIRDCHVEGFLNGIRITREGFRELAPGEEYDDAGSDVVVEDTTVDGTGGVGVFVDVTYGVRVEDDDTTVEANRFRAASRDTHAVLLGTGPRTEALGRPVRGTRLVDNTATILGNPDPYRWAHGHEGTVDEGNTALGAPASLCEGPPVPMPALIFVEVLAVQPPDAPPVARPEGGTPLLGPLPPCG